MNLNFKQQFVNEILNRQKKHTLRYGERWQEGNKIHFYTGLRTKNAKLFATGIVKDIYRGIYWNHNNKKLEFHPDTVQSYVKNFMNNKPFDSIDKFYNELAKNDGFENYEQMKEFFSKNGKDGLYQLIVWDIYNE